MAAQLRGYADRLCSFDGSGALEKAYHLGDLSPALDLTLSNV
jgi:hypothetical protein